MFHVRTRCAPYRCRREPVAPSPEEAECQCAGAEWVSRSRDGDTRLLPDPPGDADPATPRNLRSAM